MQAKTKEYIDKSINQLKHDINDEKLGTVLSQHAIEYNYTFDFDKKQKYN